MKNRISIQEYRKKYPKGTMKLASKTNLFKKSENKYRNTIVNWSGVWKQERVYLRFHSKKEMARGIWLINLENSGRIKYLDMQKSFEIVPKFKDERGVKYMADFYYYDIALGTYVIEDVKSEITKKNPAYIIKRKLVKYQYRDCLFKET